jgi:hypothetical protein
MCEQLIRKNKTPMFMRQCDILLLWQSRGGKLTKYGKGPHADYYAAAYETVFQKTAPGPSRIKETITDFLRIKLAVLSGAGAMTVHATVQAAAGAQLSGASAMLANATVVSAAKPDMESQDDVKQVDAPTR